MHSVSWKKNLENQNITNKNNFSLNRSINVADNINPLVIRSIIRPNRNGYDKRYQVIIGSGNKKGKMKLRVKADGVRYSEIVISCNENL